MKAKLILSILPSIKSWIFSDGKFNVQRSVILLVTLVVLVVGTQFVEPEQLTMLVGLLDEISDIFGYD